MSAEASIANAANHLKLSLDAVARFTRRSRNVNPELTERGACVLLIVASRFDGASLAELADALTWPKTLLVAVMHGLVCELRLVNISADAERPWRRNASLSVTGIAFMAALNGARDDIKC